jgi:hypothetical protein
VTCSDKLDRTDLLCCIMNKGGCYGRPTANFCGGVWCLLGPDRQLLWLTMHESDAFHTATAGPVADDLDQHDQASCVLLLYVICAMPWALEHVTAGRRAMARHLLSESDSKRSKKTNKKASGTTPYTGRASASAPSKGRLN